MTTIQERAREAQEQALARLGGNDALLQATKDLYAKVDELSAEQKTLLVREAIMRTSGILATIRDTDHREVRSAYSALAHGVLAVAGYSIEGYREGLDFNVTGDRRVDSILDGVKDLMHQFAEATLSDEENALADTIRDAVAARMETGETFEEATAAELAAHKDEIMQVEKSKVEKSKVEEKGSSRYNGDGLYL